MHSIVPPKIVPVIEAVRDAGGRPFLVGGAVRDTLLGLEVPTKDLDFEVYHLPLEKLIALLSKFGRTDVVGRSFGVIKLWMKGLGEIDFSLPRRESKSGSGHRGFMVAPDPDMSPVEACARRDFTLNAILMDPFDGETFDYHEGIQDLKNKILRHTSLHFSEDPLRPLRAMQLAARFDLSLHRDTAALCATMLGEAPTLAKERIFGEWSKWALQGLHPSAGLRVLRNSGWSAVFPEVSEVVPNEASAADLDTRIREVRSFAFQAGATDDDLFVSVISSFARDMSARSISSFLARLGTPPKATQRISLLTAEARRFSVEPPKDDEVLFRTAVRLETETVARLAQLLQSNAATLEIGRTLLRDAERLGVVSGPPSPLLSGRDLAAMGVLPGPPMGVLLKAAFDAQLKGEFLSKEQAVDWIRREIENRK